MKTNKSIMYITLIAIFLSAYPFVYSLGFAIEITFMISGHINLEQETSKVMQVIDNAVNGRIYDWAPYTEPVEPPRTWMDVDSKTEEKRFMVRLVNNIYIAFVVLLIILLRKFIFSTTLKIILVSSNLIYLANIYLYYM